MVKKKETIYLIIGAALLVTAYFYLDTSDTLFGNITDNFRSVNWDEVTARDTVKNSIPITLLENNGISCLVSGENFEMITKGPYFEKNHELTEKLQYDNQTKTLIIPCNELEGDKSRLNVWYVVKESPSHSLKWEYFITSWDEEVP